MDNAPGTRLVRDIPEIGAVKHRAAKATPTRPMDTPGHESHLLHRRDPAARR